MNADKNGFQMSNGTHQYALFGSALFKFNKTVVHASDPRKQIVGSVEKVGVAPDPK